MTDTEQIFFEGKRPWSKIKDRILGNYMRPYLRKVSALGKPIVIADCFAGPGSFGDGTSGSPQIICNEAETQVRGKYVALFVNSEPAHHEQLQEALKSNIQNGSAVAILGSAQEFLTHLTDIAQNATLFVYLDPFGLKGGDFGTIESILGRDSRLSTELLINMSMPTLHRLAARRAAEGGRTEEKSIVWRHSLLTKVLGGEYWKDIMLEQSSCSSSEREALVMEGYRNQLKRILPFTGSCPVQADREARVKYYVTFCSRHPNAMTLMNEIMLDSYMEYFNERDEEHLPLFKGAISWKDEHKKCVIDNLKKLVLDLVTRFPGHLRNRLWEMILEDHFMKFRKPEYNAAVDELFEEGLIDIPTQRPTKRLNDMCVLLPRHLGKATPS